MSITIEVSEEIETAIRATPDGLERVRQLLESEFGTSDAETRASVGPGLSPTDAGARIDGDEVAAERTSEGKDEAGHTLEQRFDDDFPLTPADVEMVNAHIADRERMAVG